MGRSVLDNLLPATAARRARAPWAILLGCLTLVACGGDYGTIREERVASRPVKPVRIGASSAERFGGMAPPRTTGPAAAAPRNPFLWETPPGWNEVEPRSSFRIADFEVAGAADAECYLSMLPGGAGGLLANVNRWYAQMGAAPIDSAALDALPRAPLLGAPAPLVRVDGAFAGMGGETLDDARLLGLVLEIPASADTPGFTLFLKATGPREVLAAEESSFLDLARSLRIDREVLEGDPAGEPAEAVPFEGTSRAPDPPAPRDSSGAASSAAGASSEGGLELARPLPAGWSVGPDRPMRLMTVVTPAGEVSVSRAGGGLFQNVARWYGQLGLEPPTPEAVEALPEVELLGRPAKLVDLRGDFAGMGAAATPDARLVGLVCPLDGGDFLFVKLVGPEAAVTAEYFRVVAFAQSLRLPASGAPAASTPGPR